MRLQRIAKHALIETASAARITRVAFGAAFVATERRLVALLSRSVLAAIEIRELPLWLFLGTTTDADDHEQRRDDNNR